MNSQSETLLCDRRNIGRHRRRRLRHCGACRGRLSRIRRDSGNHGDGAAAHGKRCRTCRSQIQALTAETLSQLNVSTFDDFVNICRTSGCELGSRARATSSCAASAPASDGTRAPAPANFPNVAVYLDDQSAQLPGRNLDIYAADLERIEVLEGPQGTLFGAGAQAGVVRYITNKPKLDVTEGNVNAATATPATAIRTAPRRDAQSAADRRHAGRARGHLRRFPRRLHQQCPATFTRQNTDLASALLRRRQRAARQPGASAMRIRSPMRSTRSLTKAFASRLLWKINEDWNVLLAQSYQNMNARASSIKSRFDRTEYRCRTCRLGFSIHPMTRTASKTPPGPSTARSAI
jgi:iron complex outermembrane recepter protein